jgi:capsular polysaccharide transport system permease protein
MLKRVEAESASSLPGLAGEGRRSAGSTPAGSRRRDRRPWHRRPALLSLILVVALPTLLTAFYYGVIAADQYSTEARFSVRSATGGANTDLLGLVTGTAAASTITDSYIVMDYIRSREILERLPAHVDVRAVYASSKADLLARHSATGPIEDFVDYWRSMVRVNFDTTSQIISVQVRAFSAEEAQAVAGAVIRLSEGLVNDLSQRARQDAVRQSQQEVQRTEDRLKAARTAVQAFRDKEQEVDPSKKADAQLSVLGKLELDLTTFRARRNTLLQYMGEGAPTIAYIDSQIRALERQVTDERAKLGAGTLKPRAGDTISGLLASYEELVVEREFAEKAYVSALSSLERARADADRQQRYLVTFISPAKPEDALYPKRVVNTAIVLILAFSTWAIGLLAVYSIRDHIQ